MQSKTFTRLSIFVVITISLFVFINLSQQAAQSTPFPEEALIATTTEVISTTTAISSPGGIIQAIIAMTQTEVEKGLSGRVSLPKDTGMLFIFPIEGKYGFWMKDMTFPIDIVWIGPNRVVLSVLAHLSPDTYPNIYYPPAEIKYVLELNSGSAKDYGIATGTQLMF